MSFPFKVVEHTLPGQHIREYPLSINGRQETALKLAIKQYIPVDQPTPIPDNAVTIIGIPGNGSPRSEILEPLWEDLYAQLKNQSVPLRGIWIADVTNQGASGVLNEDVLGDQTNWYDHSRDLLHMVNHFRDEMPRPIIGVAHSMGCAQLVNLAIIHPRLFSTLVLFEPVIPGSRFGHNPAVISSRRRDLWPTREKATESLTKSLRTWDPRARDRYIRYGLRSVPTRLYNPSSDKTVPEGAVTLTTTKHQETWSASIANLEPESAGLDRLLLPDWDVENERPYLFSRPEMWAVARNLPFLRPSVFWVFGGQCYLSPPAEQEYKMRVTGTGIGGSGGAVKGMVEKAVLEEGNHNVVYEDVRWSAGVAGDWLRRWYGKYLEDVRFWSEYRSRSSDAEMLRLSGEAMAAAKRPVGTRRKDTLESKI